MTIEGDTLLQLQQLWDAIFSSFYQYLSTKKSWPSCKNLNSDHYDITKFPLQSDNHSKYITAKGNFESLLRLLRFHLVKFTTISSLKAPKLHVKLVTHMYYDNVFEILIAVVFNMIPQLGGLEPKAQEPVITFCLGEG